MVDWMTDEEDKRITNLKERFRERTRTINILSDFHVDVRLGSDEQTHNDDGSYQRSSRTVFINEKLFHKDFETQMALFAHEIAHAYIQIREVRIPSCKQGKGRLGEDIWADKLTCEWGFLDGLREDREHHRDYGPEYVKCLEKYDNLEEFIDCMCSWKWTNDFGKVFLHA